MTNGQTFEIRPAGDGDAAAIAEIFNQGIEERVATFETRPKTERELARLIASGTMVLVAEAEGRVLGFAKTVPYDDSSHYYAGINEATLYVALEARRRGVGGALLEALAAAGATRGLHKLTAKIFSSNRASLELFRSCSFREVGVHRRHAALDGEWKDVIVVERSLGAESR